MLNNELLKITDSNLTITFNKSNSTPNNLIYNVNVNSVNIIDIYYKNNVYHCHLNLNSLSSEKINIIKAYFNNKINVLSNSICLYKSEKYIALMLFLKSFLSDNRIQYILLNAEL